jgi:hypothetical protein
MPPTRDAFPAITLYSEKEIVEYIDHIIPRRLLRTLPICITVWIDTGEDGERAETYADIFANEIEAALETPIGAYDLQLYRLAV